MAERINFLKVKIEVYPASVEESPISYFDWGSSYDWVIKRLADEPALKKEFNVFDLYDDEGGLRGEIIRWIKEEMEGIGSEQIYAQCPNEEKR